MVRGEVELLIRMNEIKQNRTMERPSTLVLNSIACGRSRSVSNFPVFDDKIRRSPSLDAAEVLRDAVSFFARAASLSKTKAGCEQKPIESSDAAIVVTSPPLPRPKLATATTLVPLVSILVNNINDDTETQQRRNKRRRKIHRKGGVRFEKDESGRLKVDIHERPLNLDRYSHCLHWSREEKKVFRQAAAWSASELRMDNPEAAERLSDIYHNCGKEYGNEAKMGEQLHKVWFQDDDDEECARGLEHECCDRIQDEWEAGVATLLYYQSMLRRMGGEATRSGMGKLLRRRSLDLSRRSRHFARYLALADAIEAERNYTGE
jgi:hypothetical protein